jgi:hypothetical protein
VISNLVSALVAAFVTASVVNPAVYEQVGLDRKQAVAAARSNPYYAESRRWMGEKIMKFLADQGMVTWYSRPIYQFVHLI